MAEKHCGRNDITKSPMGIGFLYASFHLLLGSSYIFSQPDSDVGLLCQSRELCAHKEIADGGHWLRLGT